MTGGGRITVDAVALKRDYGKPLPPVFTPNTIATSLDTNKDGKLECKEIGTWVPETDGDSRSLNASAYQSFITGMTAKDFKTHISDTRFDGCKAQPFGALLLEAKADHGALLTDKALSSWSKADVKISSQAKAQNDVATTLGVRNEWHVQTFNDTVSIKKIFNSISISTPVIHDPMPTVIK
jgi:hypothetical protein